MTRDEHKAAIQSLYGMIAADHQADASAILNNLSNDYEETLTGYEAANANVQTLTANNEKLRNVNADLFLQVGETRKKTETKPTEQDGKKTEAEKKLTFESLFNEKGELI